VIVSELRVRLQECIKQLDAGREVMARAQEVMLAQAARIADLEAQITDSAPECQACGDGITAHDPGVCGNCFAMKYRDKQPTQTERALTDQMLEKLYWTAMDNAADILRYMEDARALVTTAQPASGDHA
jgi:hypothetical protein